MFYNTHYSFREMALIWLVMLGLWGFSLFLALKMARIELTALQQIVVIQLAGLAALFPAIGPFLAPVAAIYLIYRMADAELPIIIAAVLITRFIAAILAIGIERALVRFGFLQG
jgi:hypothetical protein